MSNGTHPADKPLEVFISYSRKDYETAERLRCELEARGFEAYLDKHDIMPGEPWQERLGQLIVTADTVVFLVSPNSVSSQVCDWEVNEAERRGRRIIPAVIQETNPALVPGRLSRLNFIFMRDAGEEKVGLGLLQSALNTNVEWIREHTRLSELAIDWERHGRAAERLLRGRALAAAELWLPGRPREAPEPTALQRDYIVESRKAEQKAFAAERATMRFTQRLLSASVVLLLGIVGVLVGWINQRFLIEQYNWRFVMKPATLTAARQDEVRGKPGNEFKECNRGCPAMVVIPAGTFLMGARPGQRDWDNNRGPQRKVAIGRALAVSKHEVTFAEYDMCTAMGSCPTASDSAMGRNDRPVIGVTWEEAKVYVAWLSRMTGKPYRLLSEAEWEYAARGITEAEAPHTPFAWGEEVGRGNANCRNCGSQWDGRHTTPVGSFKPNAFGLYDMHGNVWEWVEDNWHPNYDGAPSDGSAWLNPKESMRNLRGGSWLDNANLLYAAMRNGTGPNIRQQNVGFRVARNL